MNRLRKEITKNLLLNLETHSSIGQKKIEKEVIARGNKGTRDSEKKRNKGGGHSMNRE